MNLLRRQKAIARRKAYRHAKAKAERERLVTVCAACLRACCWHGEFMCVGARTAGTTEMQVGKLRELGLEHHHYWKEDFGK